MRYALTITSDPNAYDWGDTDTIIVETDLTPAEGGEAWYNNKELIAKVITDYGWDKKEAEKIVNEGWYFVRNIEDVDVYLNTREEI